MRSAAVAALLLYSVAARAYDLRTLTGFDTLITSNAAMNGVEDAELGINLRADLRDVAHRFDFKLDFQGREGFVGDSTYNNLYELSARAKNLAGVLDVTVGRFRVPTGFWLIADGGMLTVKYTGWLKQAVFGGLRAFTTGRRNTWMTDSPEALPLVGTSLLVNHKYVTGSLGFTWSQDGIDLHTDWIPDKRQTVLERHLENEYFLDANVTVYPHEKVFLSAGASLGTRYDIQFNAMNPYGPTTLGVATLGSFDVFGIAEYRPIKRLRLQYTFNFERVRLFQSELLATDANGQPLTAADGSFEDHDFRALWLAWKALRLELNYRLRIRANTDYEHHLTLGFRGDSLWKGLGLFGSIGIDVDSGLPAVTHDRIIYSAGLSYVHRVIDLRAGITYTDGIGSGLSFSIHQMTQTGSAPTELFPFVLETNRVAFVRAFATFWKMYAGADVEFNLTAAQLRVLAQIGMAL